MSFKLYYVLKGICWVRFDLLQRLLRLVPNVIRSSGQSSLFYYSDQSSNPPSNSVRKRRRELLRSLIDNENTIYDIVL